MVGRKDLHDKQKLYKRLKRKNESEEQRADRLEKRRNYDCLKKSKRKCTCKVIKTCKIKKFCSHEKAK